MSNASEGAYWPYGYRPNTPVATVALVLLLGVLVSHIFFYFKRRTWFFVFVLLGICLEILALLLRIPTGEAVAASFLALCWAPSIIAAGIHMVFGRLIWFVTPASKLNWRVTLIPPRWFALLFIGFDFIALVIEVIGSSTYLSNNDGTGTLHHETPSRNLAFGLTVQAIVLSVSVAIATMFAIRSKRWGAFDNWKAEGTMQPQWQRLLLAVIVSNTLLLIRTVYAMIQAFTLASNTHQPVPHYLLNHEWVFWVFDGVPVLAACAIFLVFHPGQYLPKRFMHFRLRKRDLLAEKQREENGTTSLENEKGAAPLFVDTSTVTPVYDMPMKAPKVHISHEREHPAFG